MEWYPYISQVNQHTVVGDLRVYPALHSPQLSNERPVYVWLPPRYEESDHHYPVFYMHDAQNLFDAHVSYSGEWGVDETMTALATEGLSAIIVGLPNMRERRGVEYSPYDFEIQNVKMPGQGKFYIEFLTDTVKPFIDSTFRTLPDKPYTGIAGSSMGGLISLYGYITRPDVFGLCGAFSTAYWFGDNGLLNSVRHSGSPHGRVYMDVGTNEGVTLSGWNITAPDLDAAYVQGVRDLRDALIERGYIDGDSLRYVEAEGAPHNEGAWRVRFPNAMRFLLG